MLNSINISHIFVFDQDKALDFYVGKLGLEVSADLDLGVMRWLTVRVPGDQTRDILLEEPQEGLALHGDQVGQLQDLAQLGEGKAFAGREGSQRHS